MPPLLLAYGNDFLFNPQCLTDCKVKKKANQMVAVSYTKREMIYSVKQFKN